MLEKRACLPLKLKTLIFSAEILSIFMWNKVPYLCQGTTLKSFLLRSECSFI